METFFVNENEKEDVGLKGLNELSDELISLLDDLKCCGNCAAFGNKKFNKAGMINHCDCYDNIQNPLAYCSNWRMHSLSLDQRKSLHNPK